MTKPNGWFSRRHETSNANRAAREAYQSRAERRPKQHWNDKTKKWVKVA